MTVDQASCNVVLLSKCAVKKISIKIKIILSGEGVESSRSSIADISDGTYKDYRKRASKFLFIDESRDDNAIPLMSVKDIITEVRAVKALSTLRAYATGIRYFACHTLDYYHADFLDYLKNDKWSSTNPYRLANPETFFSILKLADLYPRDYRQNDWKPKKRRQSKILSLKGLDKNWREIMALEGHENQYKIAMLVALVTGVRPIELEKGVLLTQGNGKLVALIQSAKVTKYSGQPTRKLVLKKHAATDLLIAHMNMQENKNTLLVKVNNGNAVTKYMTRVGKKQWPEHKENITVYTARHAMASDCKKVDSESGEESPMHTSETLGHQSDRTKRTYGKIYHSGGENLAPESVEVPYAVRVHAKNTDFYGRNKIRKSKFNI